MEENSPTNSKQTPDLTTTQGTPTSQNGCNDNASKEVADEDIRVCDYVEKKLFST